MKHVLVVDDEATLRGLLVEEVEELGYRCTEAEHGAAALKRVAEEMPDLIVTDGAMPVLDGPGLIAALQQRYGASAAPVLMVSAHSGEADVERAKAAGASDYVRKPVDVDEFSEKINALLRQSGV